MGARGKFLKNPLQNRVRKGSCETTTLLINIKYSRLSHDGVTCDVERDVSTAYCYSSSGDPLILRSWFSKTPGKKKQDNCMQFPCSLNCMSCI